MNTTTYDVLGMTCAHCVAAVSEEVEALPGVARVDVALVVAGASTLTVVADRSLSLDEVRAAVDEAGYELGRR